MAHTRNAQEESGEKTPRYCLEASKVWEVEAPLHVTGFWLPIWRRDPLYSGSLGAGLLLEPGVLAVVEVGENCPRDIQLVARDGVLDVHSIGVIARLARTVGGIDATVRINLPVPLGSGYAASGALALVYASITALLNRRGFEDAARAAHIAEVEEGTGLGDVIAMYYGRMLEARTAPGGPGIGRVESYPVDAVYAVTISLGYMATGEMHSSRLELIRSAFSRAFSKFMENPGLDSFLEAAREFSIETGFAGKEAIEVLDRLVRSNIARGWYVKKKVVVVIPENGCERDVVEQVEELKGTVFVHRIAGYSLVARRAL